MYIRIHLIQDNHFEASNQQPPSRLHAEQSRMSSTDLVVQAYCQFERFMVLGCFRRARVEVFFLAHTYAFLV